MSQCTLLSHFFEDPFATDSRLAAKWIGVKPKVGSLASTLTLGSTPLGKQVEHRGATRWPQEGPPKDFRSPKMISRHLTGFHWSSPKRRSPEHRPALSHPIARKAKECSGSIYHSYIQENKNEENGWWHQSHDTSNWLAKPSHFGLTQELFHQLHIRPQRDTCPRWILTLLAGALFFRMITYHSTGVYLWRLTWSISLSLPGQVTHRP